MTSSPHSTNPDFVAKAIQAFENSLEMELTPAEVEYLLPHKKRIVKSLEWIAPYVREDTRLLDLGGGMFPHILKGVYPSIRGEHTQTDLRYALPLSSESYDLLVNTELLEHLKDQVESDMELFNFSGFHMLLSESYRLLKPGGVMLVTTPNACSLGVLYRLLMGWPPHYYIPHVREYTVHELKRFLEDHHFAIERLETLNVYDDLPTDKYRELSEMLSNNGYSPELRGDCTFVIARK